MTRVPPAFRALALATAALAFGLVILGATVRVTGSGMGCPDWPLCYGHWLPPWNRAAILEWLHRDLAALVSLGSFALVAWIARTPGLRRRFWHPAVCVVVALVAQIALGAYTVARSNDPPSVAAHLATGYVFFGALVAIARRAVLPPAPAVDGATRVTALTAVATVLAQVFVGGLVAASFAGRACPDFPTCAGSWWPAGGGPMALQMAHRYIALGVGAGVLLAAVARGPRGGKAARVAARLAVGMVVVQIALGLVAVLGPFDLAIRILHQIGAASLFTLVWLAFDATLDRESVVAIATSPVVAPARPAARSAGG